MSIFKASTFFAAALALCFGLIVVLVPVMLAHAAPAKDWRTLRIGIDSLNPPFSSMETGETLTGFDVAIAKALCDALKAKCEFVAAPREALIASLLAHKTDAVVASIAITLEARKAVDFTDKYYSMPGRFVTARGSGVIDSTTESLRGKTIGAVAGSRYATYLGEVYAPKGATVKLYKSDAEAYADVSQNRISALFGNSIRLYRWFEDGAGGRCCRFIGPAVRNSKTLGDGAGIAVRREDGDLRDLLNKALADILRDGSYEKINSNYFSFLIY